MDALRSFIVHNYAKFIFTGVFLLAAIPMLYYYYRRNPHHRFRPSFGEMTLVSLLALMICTGAGFGLGGIFKPENDGKALSSSAADYVKPHKGYQSTGGSEDDDSDDDDKGKIKREDKSSRGWDRK